MEPSGLTVTKTEGARILCLVSSGVLAPTSGEERNG